MNRDNLINIVQTNGPTLQYDGELLAHVSSESQDSDRWTELKLYKTVSNKYVTVVEGHTVFAHEKKFIRAQVYNTLDEITRTFRYSNLAKQLYEKIDFIPIKRL